MTETVQAEPVDPPSRDDPWTVRTADGRRVAYAEFGAPDGTPVVLLHGTPGSRLLGAALDAPARRRGVRVLVPDRPGYGRSPPWPDRTLADTGRFVAPVLDDAGVDRAGVVGFSGGGPHALALAATRGDLVAGVDVVSGTVPPSLGGDRPPVIRLLGTLATRVPTLLRGMLWGQVRVARSAPPSFVLAQYTTRRGRRELPEGTAELFRREFVAALARHREGVVTETRGFEAGWGFDLEGVDARVRLFHGSDDGNVPVGGARRLADRLPDATLVECDADHVTTLFRNRSRILDRHA